VRAFPEPLELLEPLEPLDLLLVPPELVVLLVLLALLLALPRFSMVVVVVAVVFTVAVAVDTALEHPQAVLVFHLAARVAPEVPKQVGPDKPYYPNKPCREPLRVFRVLVK